jgi:hippurate hydrolase
MKNNQNKAVALQQKNAFSGGTIVIDSKLSSFGRKRITKMTHPIIEALRGNEARFTELRFTIFSSILKLVLRSTTRAIALQRCFRNGDMRFIAAWRKPVWSAH